MARERKLEGMLKAVKDIKENYYVGTKDAYDVVKKIGEIYDNPEKIAIRLNHELRQRFDKVSYEATPERAVGLMDKLSDAVIDGVWENENFLDDEFTYEDINLRDRLGVEEFIGETTELINPETAVKRLLPYFVRANEQKVDSDDRFGDCVYDYCDEKFEEAFREIDVTEKHSLWRFHFLNYLNNVDWNNSLSKATFNHYQRISVSSAMFTGLLTSKIVDRIIHDRYDHKLEYRRQVLCGWLMGFEGIESYEEVVEIMDRNIKSNNVRYKKLEDLNAPETILENSRRMAQSNKFIRQLLGSEKNFIQRYLKN